MILAFVSLVCRPKHMTSILTLTPWFTMVASDPADSMSVLWGWKQERRRRKRGREGGGGDRGGGGGRRRKKALPLSSNSS